MSTYRYGMQQRPTPLQFVADITLTDPPADLVAHNAFAMAMLQATAVTYMQADVWNNPAYNGTGVTGVVVFESIDGVLIAGSVKTPVMMGYTMTQAHLDALVKQFNETILTSMEGVPVPAPAPRKHGHSHK